MAAWPFSLALLPLPRHHTFVTPRRKILSCANAGLAWKRIAHFGAEQFLELPRGLDHHRGAFLAEQVKPVPGEARRGVALHVEIVLPLFLAVLRVEAGQHARGRQREDQLAVAESGW